MQMIEFPEDKMREMEEEVCSEPGINKTASQAKSTYPPHTPPVLENKVVWKYSHAHLFVYVHGCFCIETAEFNSCDRLCSPQNLKYLLSGSL